MTSNCTSPSGRILLSPNAVKMVSVGVSGTFDCICWYTSSGSTFASAPVSSLKMISQLFKRNVVCHSGLYSNASAFALASANAAFAFALAFECPEVGTFAFALAFES